MEFYVYKYIFHRIHSIFHWIRSLHVIDHQDFPIVFQYFAQMFGFIPFGFTECLTNFNSMKQNERIKWIKKAILVFRSIVFRWLLLTKLNRQYFVIEKKVFANQVSIHCRATTIASFYMIFFFLFREFGFSLSRFVNFRNTTFSLGIFTTSIR